MPDCPLKKCFVLLQLHIQNFPITQFSIWLLFTALENVKAFGNERMYHLLKKTWLATKRVVVECGRQTIDCAVWRHGEVTNGYKVWICGTLNVKFVITSESKPRNPDWRSLDCLRKTKSGNQLMCPTEKQWTILEGSKKLYNDQTSDSMNSASWRIWQIIKIP